MLKILWKRGEISPEEQFLLLPTIFCYLMLDFYVKTRIRFSLRDKRLFEIIEVEITRVDCIVIENLFYKFLIITESFTKKNITPDNIETNPEIQTCEPFSVSNNKILT